MKARIVELKTESTEQFLVRLGEHAAALDRGESLKPGITISFADPMEMMSVMTAEKMRLIATVKTRPFLLAGLATELGRDVRAVSRDVKVLESAGLLRTSFRVNPGHGRMKVVEAVAERYQLVANF